MARAIAAGRKTQTRRLATSPLRKCRPGDRLWVRETCSAFFDGQNPAVIYAAGDSRVVSEEEMPLWTKLRNYGRSAGMNVPSIHMPKWASRLTLNLTGVRVEPLNAIDDAGAIAEGVTRRDDRGWHVEGVEHPNVDFPCLSRVTPREMYAALWDTLHGSGEWLGNPDVLVLTFTVDMTNIAEGAN